MQARDVRISPQTRTVIILVRFHWLALAWYLFKKSILVHGIFLINSATLHTALHTVAASIPLLTSLSLQ